MSNSNKVSVDNFSSKLMEYLQEYKEDISEEVKNTSDKLIKEAAGELRHISPKAKKTVRLKGGTVVEPGSYAKSWSTKNKNKTKDIYSKVAYNKAHYRLTHLLEFGHANRDGSRTRAIPHIRNTENKYKEKFVKELEEKIRRGV